MEMVSNIGVGLGDILAMHASIHVVAHNYILWDKVKLLGKISARIHRVGIILRVQQLIGTLFRFRRDSESEGGCSMEHIPAVFI